MLSLKFYRFYMFLIFRTRCPPSLPPSLLVSLYQTICKFYCPIIGGNCALFSLHSNSVYTFILDWELRAYVECALNYVIVQLNLLIRVYEIFSLVSALFFPFDSFHALIHSYDAFTIVWFSMKVYGFKLNFEHEQQQQQ